MDPEIPSSNRSRELLHNNNVYAIQHPIVGLRNFVHNVTVFGAIITSILSSHDRVSLSPMLTSSSNLTAPSDPNIGRLKNVRHLQHLMPFPLAEWPPVFTKPCPQFSHGHKTERGVALAHYQIWLDFVFFDNDVLDARKRPRPEYLSGTPYSSISGKFRAFENGSLYKDDVPFQEEDILVVLEDDVDVAIQYNDLNSTLAEELGSIGVDLLFLGWCEGRLARPVPLCAHAYAVTRRGARKLIQYYEPCGKAVDEQFVMMVKNGWLTYRRVHAHSFRNLNSAYPMHGDKTFGIFRQKKHAFGSINGH